MFANRLQKNFKHLRRWAGREDISCYRVYDADLPEYAVAVDLYDGWAHVQEYAPPGTVDPVQARRRLKEVMAVVPEVLGIPESHAVLKVRSPPARSRPVREAAGPGLVPGGRGGRAALPRQSHRLPRHRPLPRSPAGPAAHPRASLPGAAS